MSSQKKYTSTTADWRRTLRLNKRRTRFIIMTFFLIYGGIGLLVDAFLTSSANPQIPLSEIFLALITFQVPPIATLIMLGIAGAALMITFIWHNKFMLMGTEYYEITPETARGIEEKQLYHVIEEMKVASGLIFMPKVFIIEADYMNAFASGYSEKSAMVAITRGLLEKLNRSETQAVMAHELSHIRHLDIKLTMTAAILANIMTIVIDILFYNILFGSRRNGGRESNQLFFIIMIIRFLLPIITVLLMLYLSRTREYMADAGCVELMRDNEPLARALMKINADHQQNQEQYTQDYRHNGNESVRHAAYIYDPTQAGIKPVKSISDLFSSHPSLKARLTAIGIKLNG